MAKHVIVQKKKTIRWSGVIGTLLALSLVIAFITQIFVRTTNQQLAIQIQKVQSQIAEVQSENETITASIAELRDYNRVVSIANEAGLESSKNTVTVKGE